MPLSDAELDALVAEPGLMTGSTVGAPSLPADVDVKEPGGAVAPLMASRQPMSDEELNKLVMEAAPKESANPEVLGSLTGIDVLDAYRALKNGDATAALDAAVDMVPFGKELTNAAIAGILRDTRRSQVNQTPEAQEEMKKLGYKPVTNEPATSFGEDYLRAKHEREARVAQEEKEHPMSATGGKALGLGLSVAAPLPGFKGGSGPLRALKGVKGSVASGLLNASAYAGAGRLAGGEELAEGKPVEALEEAGKAAIDPVTLAAGAGGGLVAHGIQALPNALRSIGINQGRKVLTNGADQLSRKLPIKESAVEEALKSGAIKPLSTTGATYERLSASLEEQADKYRTIISELEKRGVKGPKAQEIADQLMHRGAQIEPHVLTDTVPNLYREQMVQPLNKAKGPELGLSQAENLKRSAQGQARYGELTQKETPVNEAWKDIASVYRQAVEDAVARHGLDSPEVKRLAEQFVPVKERLGNLIEAGEAAERGAARGAQRHMLGLPEWMAIAGQLASGNPYASAKAIASGVGTSLARNRLPSTVAAGAYKGSEALRRFAPKTANALRKLIPVAAVQRGESEGEPPQ